MMCPNCKTVHGSDCVVSIGRFTPAPRYRANYNYAPLRNSKSEAKHDYCNYQKRKEVLP